MRRVALRLTLAGCGGGRARIGFRLGIWIISLRPPRATTAADATEILYITIRYCTVPRPIHHPIPPPTVTRRTVPSKTLLPPPPDKRPERNQPAAACSSRSAFRTPHSGTYARMHNNNKLRNIYNYCRFVYVRACAGPPATRQCDQPPRRNQPKRDT